MTVGEVVALVQRRWRTGLAAGCLVIAVAAVAAAMVTPLYESRAVLTVDQGRKPVEFREELFRGDLQYSLLNTQRELLTSNRVLSQAIEQVGLTAYPPYSTAASPVDTLRRRLAATTNRDSWTIILTLRDEDFGRAQAAAEAVVGAYLAAQVEQERERSERALAFLQQQAEEAGRNLEVARSEESRYAAEHGLTTTDPESNFISRRLISLNESLAQLQRELAGAEAVLSQVREAESIAAPDARRSALLRIEAVGRAVGVAEQVDSLLDAEKSVAMVRQRYLEKHPRMLEAMAQVEARRLGLEQALSTAREAVESNHRRILDQRDALRAHIAREQAALLTYRDHLGQLRRLSDVASALQKVHQTLVERQSQERVTARIEASRVQVIDPPSTSPLPVSGNQRVVLIAGAALGLVAAVLACLAHEMLDHRVRGAAEAARLAGVPVLAEIPMVAALPALDEQVPEAQETRWHEAIRALRAALRLIPHRSEAGRCVLVASPESGDGRSTVVARLALSLATSGMRVLVVDADLRQPALDRLLDAADDDAEAPGLGHLLAGEPGVLPRETRFPLLHLMPAGARPGNPAELLHSLLLPQWLDRCRADYDFILIDSSPLAEVADALAVGKLVDGILLVVRDRGTTRAGLATSLERLQHLRSLLQGLAVNGVGLAEEAPDDGKEGSGPA